MNSQRLWRIVAAVVAPVLVLGVVFTAGPGSALFDHGQANAADPKACAELIEHVGATTQQFVSGFDADTAATARPLGPESAPAAAKPTLSEQQFTASLGSVRAQITEDHCDSKEFRDKLSQRLRRVEGHGVLADALVRQLRVSLAGKLPASPVTREINPADDLDQVLAELPVGSTLVLSPGDYVRDRPVVLLRSITVSGAGADRTSITSRASGAAIVVMGGVHLTLRGARMLVAATESESGIVAGAGSTVDLADAEVLGGSSGSARHGGSGLVLAGDERAADGRGSTTASVVRSTISGFGAAGLVASAGAQADVRSATFATNGECGVCFISGARGTVTNSVFADNAVGVAVTARATPTLRHNDFRGGRVGVQAVSDARPRVEANTFSKASTAAMLYLDHAAGTATRNRCRSQKFGVVVRRGAHPAVSGGTCATVGFG